MRLQTAVAVALTVALLAAPAAGQEVPPEIKLPGSCYVLWEKNVLMPHETPVEHPWVLCPGDAWRRAAEESPLHGVFSAIAADQDQPENLRWWAKYLSGQSGWSLNRGACQVVKYIRSIWPADPDDDRDRSAAELKAFALDLTGGAQKEAALSGLTMRELEALAAVRGVDPQPTENELIAALLDAGVAPRPPQAELFGPLAEKLSGESIKSLHDPAKAAWGEVAARACPKMEPRKEEP